MTRVLGILLGSVPSDCGTHTQVKKMTRHDSRANLDHDVEATLLNSVIVFYRTTRQIIQIFVLIVYFAQNFDLNFPN
jgi:hypothetical protein